MKRKVAVICAMESEAEKLTAALEGAKKEKIGVMDLCLGSYKGNEVAVARCGVGKVFAAMCADRCALFSQGTVAACDETRRFLSDNRFYTTAASRITRRSFDGAVTEEQALSLMEQNGGDR